MNQKGLDDGREDALVDGWRKERKEMGASVYEVPILKLSEGSNSGFFILTWERKAVT